MGQVPLDGQPPGRERLQPAIAPAPVVHAGEVQVLKENLSSADDNLLPVRAREVQGHVESHRRSRKAGPGTGEGFT